MNQKARKKVIITNSTSITFSEDTKFQKIITIFRVKSKEFIEMFQN
jgi:hypothetical protein